MKKPMIYAHRGASKYAPENTMAAFRKAMEAGAQGIELDIHLTADGCLVVTHDDQLGRTCKGKGMIKDLELKHLKSLDFGDWFSKEFAGERIPTLNEVIELLQGKGMVLNIEIKASFGRFAPGIEKKTAEVIMEYGIVESTIVSSFNHNCLLRLKEESPDIVTAPLYDRVPVNMWKHVGEIGAAAVHPNYAEITPEMVEGCKSNGIAINAWTVDREKDIRRLALMGVDGIITNVPDVALKVLGGLDHA